MIEIKQGSRRENGLEPSEDKPSYQAENVRTEEGKTFYQSGNGRPKESEVSRQSEYGHAKGSEPSLQSEYGHEKGSEVSRQSEYGNSKGSEASRQSEYGQPKEGEASHQPGYNHSKESRTSYRPEYGRSKAGKTSYQSGRIHPKESEASRQSERIRPKANELSYESERVHSGASEKSRQSGNNRPKESKSSYQPKNFRQIGTPQGHQKVYFEDYVYTFLHPIFESTDEMRVCVLVGRVEKDDKCHYIFVNGAMEIPDVQFAGFTPLFSERTREKICNLIRDHFEESYLVGWYLDVKGNPPKLTMELESIHRNFFGGRDKVFLLADSLNREEKIFACDNTAIWQEEGYYIYYEKNSKMQEYMIRAREQSKNTIEPEQVVDEALKNYRELLLQKDSSRPHGFRLSWYATGFLLVLTVSVLGVNMLNNYEKMKKMEEAITVMANRNENATESLIETEDTEVPVIVESVDGNVTKQTDTESNEDNTDDTQEASTQNTDTAQPDTQAAANPPDTEAATQTLSEADTIRLQGYYIVQKGDSLAAISRLIYGTDEKMKDICEKNGIENSDEIYAGEKLLLP